MLEHIKKVSFGKLAAEREIQEGLKQYFIETGAFNRIKDGSKSILLGNRGTGKSAIIKMLAEHYKRENCIVVELIPEDYSYEMLHKTLMTEQDGSWAKTSSYTAAWKYLIYVIAMKYYIDDNDTIVKSTAKDIFNYIRTNHKGYKKQSYWDIFVSYLKRIEGLKIGPYEAGIKTKELHQLYKLEEIAILLDSLTALAERKSIVFLIDELDKGWDASEDAKAFVGGLFQASITLNQLSPNFRVIVSLRRELYDNIPALYEDFQKYNDIFEIIEWDKKSLLKLITKRIGYFLPEFSGKTDIEKWKVIFADQIHNLDSYEYTIQRTLNRPREIIQFCIDARARAVEIRSNKIDINAIVTSEVRYSENRTKDIAIEYKFQYPNLLDLFEIFIGKSCIFSRVELEEICTKILLGEIKSNGCNIWLNNQSEEFIINVLWQVGFLKIFTKNYVQGILSEDYFGANEIGQKNIGNINRFMIHPMFRMYLGIIDVEN